MAQSLLHKIWTGYGTDQRVRLHAWPQGEAFAVFLPEIPSQKPQAKSDAKSVGWLPLDENTLARLRKFSNHRAIGQRAIHVYGDKTGARIFSDGSIGK